MHKFLYDNDIDDATITATSEYSDIYGAENVIQKQLDKVWRSGTVADHMLYGDCENALSPTLDTAPDAATNGTMARNATHYAGTYSWRLNKDSAGGAGDATVYLNAAASSTSSLRGLTAGNSYALNLWMYSTHAVTTSMQIRLQEYYSAAWHDILDLNNALATTWENLLSMFTVNPLSTAFRIQLFIDTAQAANRAIYIDDIKIYDVPRLDIDLGAGLTLDPSVISLFNYNALSTTTIKMLSDAAADWQLPDYSKTITWAATNIIQFDAISINRYCAIYFDDVNMIGSEFQLGYLFLGSFVEMPIVSALNPINWASLSFFARSSSGVLFGQKANRKLKAYKLAWSILSESEIAIFETLFDAVEKAVPFILVWDSSQAFPFLANGYFHFLSDPELPSIVPGFEIAGLSISIEECR